MELVSWYMVWLNDQYQLVLGKLVMNLFIGYLEDVY